MRCATVTSIIGLARSRKTEDSIRVTGTGPSINTNFLSDSSGTLNDKYDNEPPNIGRYEPNRASLVPSDEPKPNEHKP